MKFKKNNLFLQNKNQEFINNLILIVSASLFGVSVILQVVFLLCKLYVALIIVDIIFILILVALAIYFILKCFCSYIVLKNEVVIIRNMQFINKTISYEDFGNVVVKPYSDKISLLNKLWGEYIFVYDTENRLLFKTSNNEEVFNLLNARLQKFNKSEIKQD